PSWPGACRGARWRCRRRRARACWSERPMRDDRDRAGGVTRTAAPAVGGAASGGVTDARIAAAEVCADLRSGELLDPSFERRAARLDARDRRWAQELLWGMLRRRAWLDAALGARVNGGI